MNFIEHSNGSSQWHEKNEKMSSPPPIFTLLTFRILQWLQIVQVSQSHFLKMSVIHKFSKAQPNLGWEKIVMTANVLLEKTERNFYLRKKTWIEDWREKAWQMFGEGDTLGSLRLPLPSIFVTLSCSGSIWWLYSAMLMIGLIDIIKLKIQT